MTSVRTRLFAAVAALGIVVTTSACGARLTDTQIASATNGNAVRSGSNNDATGNGDTGVGAGDAGGPSALPGANDPGAGTGTGTGGGGAGTGTGTGTGGGGGGGGGTATTAPGSKTPAGNTPTSTCPDPAQNGGATDVGVTATEIKVGNVSTIGGPVPGLFKGAQLGAQAYVSYFNSLGGFCGRKLSLVVKDDGLDAAQNKAAYQSLSGQVFAMLGSFSVVSDGGYDVVAQTKIPAVQFAVGGKWIPIPTFYSPGPIPPGWYQGGLAYYKNRFPNAVAKMALFVSNADQARAAADGQRAAAKALGYNFVYEKQLEPTETGYDQYANGMKAAGARGIFASCDVATLANLAKALKAQNYTLDLPAYGGSAYDAGFLSLGGAAVEGAVIQLQQALFQGEDSATIPEVALLNKWYRAVGGKIPDLYATYAWSSGRLLEQALKASGPKATRTGLVAALGGIHKFNSNGLLPDEDVGAKTGSPCFTVVDVKGGKFVRDPDAPTFRCNDGPYFYLK